ncbi:hypothetical protein J2W22_002912 [Sphingomonas kyeonggiensis]|uniref:hypothetical protein n=1 Tax=Sphingomonas kyeonggiensis TaxID=1268553 RepID=UPI0027861D73|nr:hypothetical protein [Sphingomonas kyeonggiensis]MDQ0250848.1 hypothetical protein [Sphingomonas kyeonggiensis]
MDLTAINAPQRVHDTEELMAAYGIECVPVAYFHWNGYRYTALRDAIAAAKRAAAGGIADA